jgi:hypothetical protein
MPTNSDSNQASTGSITLSPIAQAAVVGVADDDSTIASAGGNDTISIDSGSDLSVTVEAAGSDADNIDAVTVGGNDTITVVTVNNSGSGSTPLTTTVAPAIGIDDSGVYGNASSGGNDTITIDDGPASGPADVIPGDGSFIPLEPGDGPVDTLNDSNGTLGLSVLGPGGGADGGDPVSADIREAPIINRDPPIDDGRGNPPVGNGGGFELVPVRIGAPLPPVLDPDDLLDAGLGTVEISLPPAALVPAAADVPPPVLDNGLTMIAQAPPAAGSDDSLTILAATA